MKRPRGSNGVKMRPGRNGGWLKTGGVHPNSGRPRIPDWCHQLRWMERVYPEWQNLVTASHADPCSPLGLAVMEALAAVAYQEPPDASKMLAVMPKLARRYGRR